MKFLKFTFDTDSSVYVNYIPTEQYNFALVSHLMQKTAPKVEGVEQTEPSEPEELAQAIIFESASMMDKVEQVMTEVKHSRDGKIITRKFKNEVIRTPYQTTVDDKDAIANILKWLESNVID